MFSKNQEAYLKGKNPTHLRNPRNIKQELKKKINKYAIPMFSENGILFLRFAQRMRIKVIKKEIILELIEVYLDQQKHKNLSKECNLLLRDVDRVIKKQIPKYPPIKLPSYTGELFNLSRKRRSEKRLGDITLYTISLAVNYYSKLHSKKIWKEIGLPNKEAKKELSEMSPVISLDDIYLTKLLKSREKKEILELIRKFDVLEDTGEFFLSFYTEDLKRYAKEEKQKPHPKLTFKEYTNLGIFTIKPKGYEHNRILNPKKGYRYGRARTKLVNEGLLVEGENKEITFSREFAYYLCAWFSHHQ